MRQVAVLSVALVAALVGAYTTWTREEVEVTDDAVPLYSATPADLERITWKSPELTVSIERRKDAQGEYLWVDSTETKTKKPKDPAHPVPAEGEEPAEGAEPEEPAEPTEPAAEGEPQVKHQVFMANAQGEDLWKSFAPLNALRELAPAGADPAQFGLNEPTATVEVQRKNGAITLQVGGETYGSKDRYVGYNGKVYLVDDATLRPLQFAAGRLIERSLFPLSEKDTDRVDVHLPDGTTVSYEQKNKDDAAKAFWARSDAPDTEDETGATWLGKMFRLKLKDYVEESAAPANLERVVAYDVTGNGETWKVELLKTTTEPVAWYARSDYDRSLVSLTESLVRNVVDDLDTLKAQ